MSRDEQTPLPDFTAVRTALWWARLVDLQIAVSARVI